MTKTLTRLYETKDRPVDGIEFLRKMLQEIDQLGPEEFARGITDSSSKKGIPPYCKEKPEELRERVSQAAKARSRSGSPIREVHVAEKNAPSTSAQSTHQNGQEKPEIERASSYTWSERVKMQEQSKKESSAGSFKSAEDTPLNSPSQNDASQKN